jgi:hypothetical protein
MRHAGNTQQVGDSEKHRHPGDCRHPPIRVSLLRLRNCGPAVNLGAPLARRAWQHRSSLRHEHDYVYNLQVVYSIQERVRIIITLSCAILRRDVVVARPSHDVCGTRPPHPPRVRRIGSETRTQPLDEIHPARLRDGRSGSLPSSEPCLKPVELRQENFAVCGSLPRPSESIPRAAVLATVAVPTTASDTIRWPRAVTKHSLIFMLTARSPQ